ncbi:MAG: hypothetical protein ACM3PS_05660 [Syntrophothermus sp.]
MKTKVLSLLVVLMLVSLLATPVSAGPGIGLSSVTFKLGSLIADGTLTGLGRSDVTVVLDASGIPAITCSNYGSKQVPGQSSPKISASGKQPLLGNSPVRKNGKSPFNVETVDPTSLPWDAAGCPNANWSAHIDFIYWTDATISVYDTATGILQLQRNYTCTTTRFPASVSCTQVP